MENNKKPVGRPKSDTEYVRTSIRLPKHIDTKIESVKGSKSKAKYIEDIILADTAKIQ